MVLHNALQVPLFKQIMFVLFSSVKSGTGMKRSVSGQLFTNQKSPPLLEVYFQSVLRRSFMLILRT